MDGITWGTWKDHGHAAELMWWGDVRKQHAAESVRVTLEGGPAGVNIWQSDGLVFDEASNKFKGTLIRWGGFATKFWASPVPADKAEEVVAEEKKTIGKAPGEVPAPTAHLKGKGKSLDGKCRCGCGQSVGGKSTFRQGHDARWVSRLVAEVLQDKLPRDEAMKRATEVSEALGSKLDKAVTRGLDAKAAREKAKADKDKAEEAKSE